MSRWPLGVRKSFRSRVFFFPPAGRGECLRRVHPAANKQATLKVVFDAKAPGLNAGGFPRARQKSRAPSYPSQEAALENQATRHEAQGKTQGTLQEARRRRRRGDGTGTAAIPVMMATKRQEGTSSTKRQGSCVPTPINRFPPHTMHTEPRWSGGCP